MEERGTLLHKNKDLIEITTNGITAHQQKAFNFVALQARKELKKDQSKREFYFNYSEFLEKCNIRNTNHKQLYEMLKKIADTKVELIKDARNWAYFSLFSEVKRVEGELRIQLASTMCDCLLEKNYTTLDLKVIRNFNSKYTILFYEMHEKYKAIKFPILEISDFKKLCGIEEKKTFKDFYNVQDKILRPALRELAEKENINLGYKLSKKGKAYDTIQFYIKSKEEQFKLDSSEKMTQEEILKALDDFKKNNPEYKNLFKN